MYSFQYIRHQDIDKNRWDQSVTSASNGLVYGYSWFLDIMSPGWDALATTDYKFIMPLTWRRKFGISYLYQPAFAAQLGLFGSGITAELVTLALAAIPSKFKLIEISLNEQNDLSAKNGVSFGTNFLLNLNSPSATLKKGFSDGTLRNIGKSIQAGNQFNIDIPVEEVLDLMSLKMSAVSNIGEQDVDAVRSLFLYAAPRGFARSFGVNDAGGKLVSSALVFLSHSRIYYLVVGNHPESRKTCASHALLNGILEQYSNTPFLFDFEGSDIPGIAQFYKSFGAYAVRYPQLRINRFQFWRR